MSLSIVSSGKGGVGKTTLCALLVRYFIELGKKPVLAVDADPNSTLGALLGMEPEIKIGDIREEINDPANVPVGVPKVRILETKLHEIVQEGKGFDLVTMGRGEGPGCYCYVNNLLRQLLSQLKKSYPVVIIDNEAGMEHLSRLTTDNVDCLIAVSEPTDPSVRTVGRILELVESLPTKIARKALLFNRTINGQVPDVVRDRAKDFPVSVQMELSHNCDLVELAERGGSIFELPGKLTDNPQLTRIVEWCLGKDEH